MEGDTEERNEKARKAYQALLTVTARTPDNIEYLNFSREVKALAQNRYNFTFGTNSVSTFVTAFYDAVILYALALNESLPKHPGRVNLDGGDLTRKMWGRSFKGVLRPSSFNLLSRLQHVVRRAIRRILLWKRSIDILFLFPINTCRKASKSCR